MNIQEHLSTFDSWLTTRIEEAHGARKDLAFRDRGEDERGGDAPWEYSLIEPGARSPYGEGWSVYRFSGVLPEFAQTQDGEHERPAMFERRSVLDVIAAAVRRRGR